MQWEANRSIQRFSYPNVHFANIYFINHWVDSLLMETPFCSINLKFIIYYKQIQTWDWKTIDTALKRFQVTVISILLKNKMHRYM